MIARTLRGVLRLPPRRWWGVAYTVVLATAVEVGLRAVKLPTLARSLGVLVDASPATGGSSNPPQAPDFSEAERERMDTIRRVLNHGPFNGTCLRQALIVGHTLRRREPVLRMGVRKVDGVVSAHAWLEVSGGVLDDFRHMSAGSLDFKVLSLGRAAPIADPGPAQPTTRTMGRLDPE